MTNYLSQPYQSLADLSPQPPVEWLWPGWLPRGRLTVLGGIPGVGKSYVALDLARRIIQGLPFPDGCRMPDRIPSQMPDRTPGKMPGEAASGLTGAIPQEEGLPGRAATARAEKVVYVDGQWATHELAWRIQQDPFDPTRFFVMGPEAGRMIDLGSQRDMDRLLNFIRRQQPALVVIDSLLTTLDSPSKVSRNFRKMATQLCMEAAISQTAILLTVEAFAFVRRNRFRYTNILLEDILLESWLAGLDCTVLGLHYLGSGRGFDPKWPRCLRVVKSSDYQEVEPVCFEFSPLPQEGTRLAWRNQVVDQSAGDGGNHLDARVFL